MNHIFPNSVFVYLEFPHGFFFLISSLTSNYNISFLRKIIGFMNTYSTKLQLIIYKYCPSIFSKHVHFCSMIVEQKLKPLD